MANEQLPISPAQAIKAAKWLKANFSTQICAAVKNTPFTIDEICAIFCQETAYKVLLWIDKYDPNIILARCIMDASGDVYGNRSAYPKTGAVLKKDDPALYNLLIAEGNKQRAMPQPDAPKGYKASNLLYCGYGIFQYDAQFIKADRAFFANKEWYYIEACLYKLMRELNTKWAAAKADNNEARKWKTFKAYNGSGAAATNYADNVFKFIEIISK